MKDFFPFRFDDCPNMDGTVAKVCKKSKAGIEIAETRVKLDTARQYFRGTDGSDVPWRTFCVLACSAGMQERIKVSVNDEARMDSGKSGFAQELERVGSLY